MDWNQVHAAIWRRYNRTLRPIRRLDSLRRGDLQGVERQWQLLADNTQRFIAGEPSNNALLWGARGTGKSSLIKALLNEYAGQGLRIVEMDRDDLIHLPEVVDELENEPFRFIVYCDDLAFSAGESGYRALKSALEGSLEMPPENVKIYATSNRRHLLPERMADNVASKMVEDELHPAEAIEEQVSLADRFGLQLSFYPFSQDRYLEAVDALYPQANDRHRLHILAVRFATERGVRNGRTAAQFYRANGGSDPSTDS